MNQEELFQQVGAFLAWQEEKKQTVQPAEATAETVTVETNQQEEEPTPSSPQKARAPVGANRRRKGWTTQMAVAISLLRFVDYWVPGQAIQLCRMTPALSSGVGILVDLGLIKSASKVGEYTITNKGKMFVSGAMTASRFVTSGGGLPIEESSEQVKLQDVICIRANEEWALKLLEYVPK